MNQKIPDYLANFRINIQMLLFVLVFSIAFVSIYTPFDLTSWYQSILQYVLWIASEIIFIVFVYSVFNKFALHDTRPFEDIFKRALIFVPSILFIPYLVSYLYYSLKEKNNKSEKMRCHPALQTAS